MKMVNNKADFTIPEVKRGCGLAQDIPEMWCPFSFEHSKNLLMNGCNFPYDPKEFFSPVCQNCVTITGKFAQINQVVGTALATQQDQPIPVAGAPPTNTDVT